MAPNGTGKIDGLWSFTRESRLPAKVPLSVSRSAVAKAPELPGCMAHGTTYEEALTNIEDAMILWLDTARDDGIAVPEPRQYAAVG